MLSRRSGSRRGSPMSSASITPTAGLVEAFLGSTLRSPKDALSPVVIGGTMSWDIVPEVCGTVSFLLFPPLFLFVFFVNFQGGIIRHSDPFSQRPI